MAAGTMGRGRLVAWGHNGYFGKEALERVDTGTLMVHVVRWAGRRRQPRVAVANRPQLADYLAGKGLTVVRTSMADLGTRVPKAEVICLDAHDIATPAQLEKLIAFAEKGGGIVTVATGWGWIQLHPGKQINRDFLGNTLLVRAGLAFSGAMSQRTSKQGFAVDKPVSPYVNASRALGALLAQKAERLTLDKKEMKQASVIISQAARAVSVDDKALLPRIRALLHESSEPIIPTRQNPVRSTEGLKRLIVSLQTEEMSHTPPAEVKAHPAAADFPGAVPADAPRVTETLAIDTSVPRWHSLGLYAAPGEKITLVVPPAAAGKGLRLRIGSHSDGIWQRPDWWRFPQITRTFPVSKPRTLGACSFGGLVYVDVPAGCSLGTIDVTVEGAVRAPLFMLGKTDPAAWRDTIRAYPGPWAEVGSDKVIITLPSKNVRQLDDPTALMTFWNSVLDACADLSTRPRERSSPERYVTDRQISAGYMHSGYPIMTFLDAAPRFVDLQRLKTKGDWGMFHEMGHNHQSGDWTFNGTGEVTVNLFSLYVLETCCPGAPVHGAVSPENIKKILHKQFIENASNPAKWKSGPFTALVMYIQLKDAFGWDAFKKVFAEYRALPEDQRPHNDAEKRDQWMVRMSRTVGRNLGPFFQAWGVTTSEKARASIADLPPWMPDGFPPKQG